MFLDKIVQPPLNFLSYRSTPSQLLYCTSGHVTLLNLSYTDWLHEKFSIAKKGCRFVVLGRNFISLCFI